jgi:site-specific recombinase XerD
VFVSERGAPLTATGFSRMIERAAVGADLGIKAHAHMLRHACGYSWQMTASIRALCRHI